MKLLTMIAILALPAYAETAAAWLQRLQSLEGQWTGVASDGRPRQVAYQAISGGAAVMETLTPPDEPSMVTVYHLDRDKIAMTHYCSAHNQPFLRAAPPVQEGAGADFRFVSAANLARPESGHIHRAVITIAGSGGLRHEWTWREKGVESVITMKFTRVPAR